VSALSPLLAAKLADAVYGIRDDDNVARGIAARGVSGLGDTFDLGSATIAQGTTGAASFKKDSGFALVLHGKGTRQGEVAVVTRGTATGHDWLSNFNCMTATGPAGHLVHAGFQEVFKSINQTINTALRGHSPSHIHCVGHSLGGAVANLNASSLAGQGQGVSLYTFGAPRVGFEAMARDLVRSLGANNIFRVYNPSDVVPMIPIHPFVHSPYDQEGLCVRTGGALFSLNSHYMSSYTPAVENTTWSSLRNSASGQPLHATIDQWLDRADDAVRIPGSSVGMWALGHALKAIIELGQAIGAVTFIIGSTIADMLASLLMKIANLSQALGEKIMRFIGMVMRFAGKTATTTKDITRAFLRYVLELLTRPLLALARRAINNGLRGY